MPYWLDQRCRQEQAGTTHPDCLYERCVSELEGLALTRILGGIVALTEITSVCWD